MAPDYIDFRLTLEGDPAQGYAVTAHGPGDTYARAQVSHDLDAVQAVLARIEAGEAPMPHGPSKLIGIVPAPLIASRYPWLTGLQV